MATLLLVVASSLIPSQPALGVSEVHAVVGDAAGSLAFVRAKAADFETNARGLINSTV